MKKQYVTWVPGHFVETIVVHNFPPNFEAQIPKVWGRNSAQASQVASSTRTRDAEAGKEYARGHIGGMDSPTWTPPTWMDK